ncbi:FecR domain-containing protein [Thiomicrospira sp.]|uniref:FecR domain-containing protein n=1 Tax=Thiomicrospira sp. TaxID=935 RepID=UPI002F9569A5
MFKHPNPLVLFIFLLFFSHQAWSSVGTIVLATGAVEIQRADQVIEAQTGSSILEQDKIVTGDQARAQLRFSDNTVITLGHNTEFGVETFLNEGSNQAEAKFNIAKGTFKAITGQIGKAAPDKFKVKTRTATIGIRGTIFSGRITPEREMIATLSGLIFVIEDQTGLSVEVPAGQFTRIAPGQPPEPPKPLTPQELQQMNEDGEQSSGGSTGEGSNQAGTNEEPDGLQNTGDPTEQNDSVNNTTPNINTGLVDQALNTQIEQEIDSQLSSNSSLSVVGWKIPSLLSDYLIEEPLIDCQLEPCQGDPYLDDQLYGYAFEVSQSELLGTFDNNVGWGTWEQDGISGYWVGGTEATAASNHIESMLTNQSGSYSYTGQLLGEVILNNESVESINASSLSLDFNFANYTVNGAVSFSSASTDWNLMIDSGYVEGGGFSTSASGDLNQESAFAYGYMDGRFFGPQANSIGGVFYFGSEGQTVDFYEANGVFKAVKQ